MRRLSTAVVLLAGCSQPQPPVATPTVTPQPTTTAHAAICHIGENISGVHRDFTCAEINAQPDCPACS